MDLVPTVAELIVGNAPVNWDGSSLVPIMNQGHMNRRIPILSLTTPENPSQQPRACVIRDGVKYIEPIGAPVEGAIRWEKYLYLPKRTELFFLHDDPEERYNRLEDRPEEAESMSKLLDQGLGGAINSDVDAFQSSERGIPKNLVEQLRTLGYLDVE